jgi:hypothetical protein
MTSIFWGDIHSFQWWQIACQFHTNGLKCMDWENVGKALMETIHYCTLKANLKDMLQLF